MMVDHETPTRMNRSEIIVEYRVLAEDSHVAEEKVLNKFSKEILSDITDVRCVSVGAGTALRMTGQNRYTVKATAELEGLDPRTGEWE